MVTSALVMADCIHRLGAVGDLFLSMFDGKVVHCNVSYLTRKCLESLGHKFVKELFFIAVGTDNALMQVVLLMFIIDHLAAVHQCFEVHNKILGDPLPAWLQHP